jgi:hypothetical protein
MAVVERAEREVVVEFGVPLVLVSIKWWNNVGENSRGLGRSIGVGRRVGHINQSWGCHGVAFLWCWCILWRLMLTTNDFVDSCTGEAASLFQDVIVGELS